MVQFLPRDDCWLFNRLLMSKLNNTLKYQCPRSGFIFIVQDHGWTLMNGSFHCSLFYKDYIHLAEQGKIKLAKPIVSTLTAWNNQISCPTIVTHYILTFLNNSFQLLFLFPLWKGSFLSFAHCLPTCL